MHRKLLFSGKRNLTAVILTAFAAVACTDKNEAPPRITTPDAEELPANYQWSELPEMSNTPSNCVVITHFCGEVDNGSVGTIENARNYTMLYNKDYRVSHWVAYPLHGIYTTGSGYRTDAWAYDPSPLLSGHTQMPIASGGYGQTNTDRGHQIASADRYANILANEQTFFATNMTPQNSTLNQNAWATLEAWVRGKAPSKNGSVYDTLYVVTGCYVTDSSASFSKNGVTTKVPDAYFKVLCRTADRKRTVPYADNAEAIGFWVANSDPGSSTHKEWVMQVSEIESRTGFTFFPQIDDNIKSRSAAEAKARWGL